MKKKLSKLTIAAVGAILLSAGSMTTATAQTLPNGDTFLCKWDKRVAFCVMVAPDGYCAYGGDGCSSTVPTVEP